MREFSILKFLITVRSNPNIKTLRSLTDTASLMVPHIYGIFPKKKNNGISVFHVHPQISFGIFSC